MSDKPYYKAGTKNKDEDDWRRAPEGKYTSSNAVFFDSYKPGAKIFTEIFFPFEMQKFSCLDKQLTLNILRSKLRRMVSTAVGWPTKGARGRQRVR